MEPWRRIRHLAGRGGVTNADINMFLNAIEGSNFAFQYGFLQGLMTSDCDPEMYNELYNGLMKRLQDSEKKPKKNQINMFDPCVPSGGGRVEVKVAGGSSSGGGSGPC